MLKKNLKATIGILVSLLAIVFIALEVDFDKLSQAANTLNPGLLTLGIFLSFLVLLFHSFRFWLLCPEQCDLSVCTKATFLGFAANVLFPARGGDLAKVAFLKKASGLGITRGLGRLFLEKVLDIVVLLTLAFLCLSLLIKNELSVFAFAILLLISGMGLAAIYSLARERIVFLLLSLPLVSRVDLTRQSVFKLHEMSRELVSFIGSAAFFKAFFATFVLWFVIEFALYWALLESLGFDLSLTAIAFVIVLSAVGISLPSAPSGLGVFHAAVIVAFQATGYSSEEGLIAGTLLHLVFHVPPLVLASAVFMKEPKAKQSIQELNDEEVKACPQ